MAEARYLELRATINVEYWQRLNHEGNCGEDDEEHHQIGYALGKQARLRVIQH